MGGLGNQLFGVAFGMYIARKADASITLLYPTSGLGNVSHGEPAPSVFDLGKNLELSFESRLETLRRLVGHRVPAISDSFCARTRFVSEEDFQKSLDGAFLHKVSDVFVKGYFQTRVYIEHLQRCGDLLELNPKVLNDLTMPLVENLAKPDSYAVHIRRGDYLKPAISAALPTAYYIEGLRKLGAKSDSRIIVFSDSPQLAEDELVSLNTEFSFQFAPRAFDAANSLFALSKSTNLVMSNSTFSWWAAMTGNLSKRVCRPTGWNEHLMRSDWETVRVGPQ